MWWRVQTCDPGTRGRVAVGLTCWPAILAELVNEFQIRWEDQPQKIERQLRQTANINLWAAEHRSESTHIYASTQASELLPTHREKQKRNGWNVGYISVTKRNKASTQ